MNTFCLYSNDADEFLTGRKEITTKRFIGIFGADSERERERCGVASRTSNVLAVVLLRLLIKNEDYSQQMRKNCYAQ